MVLLGTFHDLPDEHSARVYLMLTSSPHVSKCHAYQLFILVAMLGCTSQDKQRRTLHTQQACATKKRRWLHRAAAAEKNNSGASLTNYTDWPLQGIDSLTGHSQTPMEEPNFKPDKPPTGDLATLFIISLLRFLPLPSFILTFQTRVWPRGPVGQFGGAVLGRFPSSWPANPLPRQSKRTRYKKAKTEKKQPKVSLCSSYSR